MSLVLNVTADKLAEDIQKRLSRVKELEKQLDSQKSNNLKSSLEDYLKLVENINGVNVLAVLIKGADMDGLRKTVDLLKQKLDNAVILLGADPGTGDKAFLVGGVVGSSAAHFDMSALIKEIAPIIGGSGGGRKDFAQAGGNNPAKLEEALAKLREIIKGRQ
jgi:alanyl-tRNA synthetase